MAKTSDNDQEARYEIEPRGDEATQFESDEELTAEMVERNLDPVKRRVYYIHGQRGNERVVASIRSRSRKRAIEIAASQGIKIDTKDLADD